VAYQMAPASVTLNDLEGHSPVAGLFKYNPWKICATFYQISTDNVLPSAVVLEDSSSMAGPETEVVSGDKTLRSDTPARPAATSCLDISKTPS